MIFYSVNILMKSILKITLHLLHHFSSITQREEEEEGKNIGQEESGTE